MNQQDTITVKELCKIYELPTTFVSSLQEFGLIEIIIIDKKDHIEKSKLVEIEKLKRLHYELNINMEGIDVVTNLLDEISLLQDQIRFLKNKLALLPKDNYS